MRYWYTLSFILVILQVGFSQSDNLIAFVADSSSNFAGSVYGPSVDKFTNKSAELKDVQHLETLAWSYSVSPRYVSERLFVDLPDQQVYKMEIISNQHQLVMEHSEMYGENQIHVGHLVPGTYRIRFSTDDGVLAESRIVKY